MITALSSPKPGTGTTTTAALLALTIRRTTRRHAHIVDLCGDQAAVLGIASHQGATTDIAEQLTLHDLADATTDEQIATICRLAQTGEHVIVDAGSATHPIHPLLPAGTVRCWVLRPCYLALRKATAQTDRPDHVIMLDEIGRALTATDIEAVTGAQVVATIDIHPQIARAIDAGLLTARPPQTAITALTALTHRSEAA